MNPTELRVGIKCFLKNKEGKYLVLKRSPEKYPWIKNLWDIAGGRMEPGMTMTENFKRELEEETKLQITSPLTLLFAQDIIYTDNSGCSKHVVRLTHKATAEGEPILDMNENTEYKWLSKDEMLSYEGFDTYAKEVVHLGLLE